MGSFVVSWACAVETRLRACAPVAGAVLDGPGETLDSSSKKMCQAIPYQSLQFLGDRGATLFALAALHAAVLIHNGSSDEVVNIPTHGEAFFKDMQDRTARLLGNNAKKVFDLQLHARRRTSSLLHHPPGRRVAQSTTAFPRLERDFAGPDAYRRMGRGHRCADGQTLRDGAP